MKVISIYWRLLLLVNNGGGLHLLLVGDDIGDLFYLLTVTADCD